MTSSMKNIAYALLAAGFLGGAYVTALDIEHVDWLWFGIAAVAAIAGVILAKRADKAHATSGEMLKNNRDKLNESLDNIVRELESLAEGPEKKGETMRDWIDDALRPDLRRFAEARQSMVHLYGLQVYADIMSEFAAGERYLNRVWSMTADGYDEQAKEYLELATAQFEDAKKGLAAAGSGA
ncbi:MAG: hypothetical protein QNJ05_10000 [Woeseiaceae bacterium]|nr:hypothetical protein [Woeseiaceae bacterium]